jgi:hypothetical protein
MLLSYPDGRRIGGYTGMGGFSISGAIKSVTGAVSSVVGGVKDAFGKIMTPFAKLPGMAELAKALPKELGPILKIMEYLPIPMTQTVAIIVMIARYAQMAAEFRRDYAAAENFKRHIAAIQKQAQEQNIAPVTMTADDVLALIQKQRAKDVAELAQLQARRSATGAAGLSAFSIKRPTYTSTRTADRTTATRTATAKTTFAGTTTSFITQRMGANKDVAREKEIQAELKEMAEAEAILLEMKNSPAASALGSRGAAASALPWLVGGALLLGGLYYLSQPQKKKRYA